MKWQIRQKVNKKKKGDCQKKKRNSMIILKALHKYK